MAPTLNPHRGFNCVAFTACDDYIWCRANNKKKKKNCMNHTYINMLLHIVIAGYSWPPTHIYRVRARSRIVECVRSPYNSRFRITNVSKHRRECGDFFKWGEVLPWFSSFVYMLCFMSASSWCVSKGDLILALVVMVNESSRVSTYERQAVSRSEQRITEVECTA